jgi:hypothetical protein
VNFIQAPREETRFADIAAQMLSKRNDDAFYCRKARRSASTARLVQLKKFKERGTT